MRFPPTLILTLFGSGFCDLQSTMIHAHVIFLSEGMCLITVQEKTAFVPSVLAVLWSCKMLPNSMANGHCFVTGSMASFAKQAIVSPVSGLVAGFSK